MSRHSRHATEIPAGYWKSGQAYVLALITLMLGIAVGYLLRGSSSTATAAGPSARAWDSSSAALSTSAPQPGSAVAPLLEQLQGNPNDTDLLTRIGNQYYDAKDYGKAIEYYEKILKIAPDDVNVRTDMGTAIWYSGDPDRALKEYEKSLKYQPNHPQTLFNMGIVKWQGKQDPQAAILLWKKLLATNPGYTERQKVEAMIQQVDEQKVQQLIQQVRAPTKQPE